MTWCASHHTDGMRASKWHLLVDELGAGSPSLVVPLPPPSLLLAVRSPALRVSLRERGGFYMLSLSILPAG